MSTTAPQVYLDHLAAVTGGDAETLRAAWEPDGVLEFPYAGSLGGPERLEGVEAIVDRFTGAGPGPFGTWAFRDVRAWEVAGGGEYVLEMHGSSTLEPSGAPYEQDYVVRFGLAPGGRIAWMREFWDPTRLDAR